jgi:peptidyl-prolyl cis-trans isomerase A (cyclophilin A)
MNERSAVPDEERNVVVGMGGGGGKRVSWMVLGALVLFATACLWGRSPLLEPRQKALYAQAPDSFRVDFETSRGRFVVVAHRDWAPAGVDRFHYLVKNHYYDGVRFFRVIKGFVVQFGLNGDPKVTAVWRALPIADDPVKQSNRRGMLSFASAGRNTRTVQLFVNLVDNRRLDTLGKVGFMPIANVVEGMAVVDSLYSGYGEAAPRGKGPSQDSITRQGNAYLSRAFPQLDSVVSARIEREW